MSGVSKAGPKGEGASPTAGQLPSNPWHGHKVTPKSNVQFHAAGDMLVEVGEGLAPFVTRGDTSSLDRGPTIQMQPLPPGIEQRRSELH
jgi:hypothetical protein